MPLRIAQDDGVTTIYVDGHFDGESAAKVRSLLLSAPSHPPVDKIVLDFAKAREVTDIALGALVEFVRRDGPRSVQFRGITQRHRRMLRLLAQQRSDHAPAAPPDGPTHNP